MRATAIRALATMACFFALAGCGGGSSDSQGNAGSATSQEADGLTVASVAGNHVKTLTATQLAVATRSEGAVDVPADGGLQVGDVIAIDGVAVKLIAPLAGAGSRLQRFQTEQPHLDDLFESLVIDGRLSGSNSLAVLQGRETIQAAKVSVCGTLDLKATVVGSPGIRCGFSITSEFYPVVSVDGNAAIGSTFDLKKWDVIKNTGSGSIILSFDGDIALQLKKASPSLLTKADYCSSTRDAVAGARARLFTIDVPTSLPSVSIRVPVCLAFDAKAGITGKILKFSQQTAVTITVGNSAAPQVTSPLPATSLSTGAAMTDTWTVDSTSTVSTALVDVAASGSLALEAAVEVAAGVPALPSVTIVDVGIAAALIGKASITGQASPAVVNIGKTLSSIGVDPLYCLGIGVGVDFSLTGFASLPAIRPFISTDPSLSKVLLSRAIWAAPEVKLGVCDFKVNTRTVVTSSPNPGRDVIFTVTVMKDDALAGALWDDRRASGTADVKSGSGVPLCSAKMSNGVGTCSFTYSGAARTEAVFASFGGDSYFRRSDSSRYEHIVADVPLPAIRVSVSPGELFSNESFTTFASVPAGNDCLWTFNGRLPGLFYPGCAYSPYGVSSPSGINGLLTIRVDVYKSGTSTIIGSGSTTVNAFDGPNFTFTAFNCTERRAVFPPISTTPVLLKRFDFSGKGYFRVGTTISGTYTALNSCGAWTASIDSAGKILGCTREAGQPAEILASGFYEYPAGSQWYQNYVLYYTQPTAEGSCLLH